MRKTPWKEIISFGHHRKQISDFRELRSDLLLAPFQGLLLPYFHTIAVAGPLRYTIPDTGAAGGNFRKKSARKLISEPCLH
jgi:hypothetical protein